MDRIRRRDADPSILRDYKDIRNDRRASNYLLPMAFGAKGVFFLTFLLVLPFNISGFAKLYILFGVVGVYLLTCFTLMVMWSRSGQRLRTLGIIVGLLAFVVVSVVGMSTFFGI